MRSTIIAAAIAAFGTAASAQTPVLTIYTYDSFVPDWGPGPAVQANFEETCGCTIEWVAAGDGAALLSRLRLEGDRTDADIVLGLDTNLIAEALETGLFQPHGITPAGLTLPVEWADDTFLPYDWGYFAFVHRADLAEVPGSFSELADSDTSIIIEDPRSSSPGLGLLMWVEAAHGEEAGAIWEGLADNIVTVTPGWSEAYALFLEGEADMVLSYTTSPAYHLIAEDDPGFGAAAFEEGNYLQVEVAGIVAGTDQPDLARAFMEFMLTPGFQDVIPTTNWMYPAAAATLPDGFDTLTVPDTALLLPPGEAAAIRDEAVAEWQAALSR
ncbi:thiamine ABC transporter substrate binding subunit [Rhodobacterales bacterium HKCCE2091]|nr:thiamine ABC transporter substrate binding subunit [Rhodobacterales bacterium HKCCE2091]